MDNEMMSVDEKLKTVENGKMIVDSQKSCDEHVFKKARFAWQIKGQLTAENSTKGETSCVKSESEADVMKNDYSVVNDMKNKYEAQSAISVKVANDRNSNSDLVLSENKEESLNTAAKLNMNEIDYKYSDAVVNDLQSSKRKCSSDNCETDHNSPKRVKNLHNSCLEGQSGSSGSSSERFFNLQAGRATAASNPDFGRALSSILPNFHGLDIPSFIWQKQEMGCAIVDNVFNRTLEEMGLSPDPVVNLNASTRLTLENRSIETAIRNQGLRANSSQSAEHRILNSMEEIQHNATMQDFEHTQNQISMMMNVARSRSPVNIDHVECKADSGPMNCQIFDQDSCDTDHDKYELPQHAAAVNHINLNKVIIPATTGIHGNSGNKSENEAYIKDRCDEDEIPVTATENYDCITMEDSDSSECKSIADKHSEKVLDLAVSAAILNQGLTFESV